MPRRPRLVAGAQVNPRFSSLLSTTITRENSVNPARYGLIEVQATMREPFRDVCQGLNSVKGEESASANHGGVAASGRLAVEYPCVKSSF